MGREAKAKRERRHPLTKLMAKELKALELREQNVKLAMNTKEFKDSIDLRAHLLVGTPREIVDNLGISRLIVELLDERKIDHEGVQVAAQLRMGRLQLFVKIAEDARSACADRARAKLAARAAAVPQPQAGVTP